VPRGQLGSTNLKSAVVQSADVKPIADAARPVENLEVVGGVTFNAGPRVDWVERVAGRLQRARIEDVLAPRAAEGAGGRPAGGGAAGAAPAMEPRRAAEVAAKRTRETMQRRGDAPPAVPVVRPDLRQAAEAPASPAPAAPSKGAGRGPAAPADSARR
jgi:hypothetical protein